MIEITSEDKINRQLLWLRTFDPNSFLLRGKYYNFSKRLLDILAVFISFPIWLPIMLLTALAIKVNEPHNPVFFRQFRTGKNGRRFQIYKFRTMVIDADKLKEKYQYLNELNWPDFKIENDPRITRVGKIVRKFSLDELPQLFNVLKGEMSLVGPRPTSLSFDEFELWQTKRFEVLPGITGLWQITGRGSTLFDTRIRLDIIYVQKRCLRLDMQIFFRTIPSVIRQRGSF